MKAMRKYICMVVLGIFDRLKENVVKKKFDIH
jgi:hypothetical protein